jgi:uncharacterized protein
MRRRTAIGLLGGAALLAGEPAYLATRGGRQATGAEAYSPVGSVPAAPDAYAPGAWYAPNGSKGRAAAVPLASVRLLEGQFLDNQQRNLAYLLFLDPDRMLRSLRLNYGVPAPARPIGGWEYPGSTIRGHTTGHLLSGLALAYASTGASASDPARRAVRAKAEYLIAQLSALQQLATSAGYSPGYLSAFPEVFFDWLEQGQYRKVWSPYYMIHKYLAGLIDAYQLAGIGQALDVATRLADWVDGRTARLSYQHMQAILEVEFGGLPEALANLYAITGERRYLTTAQRFYHARFLDPLSAGQDRLAGEQCNISTPKVVAALRLAEETGSERYWNAARNFWDIATAQHAYAIGGQGNNEHWGPPGVLGAALSNYTCEGCVSYNMLKLTRLLHFHAPGEPALIDYYERTLVNHLLGTQDPASPHGFVAYYTGLSAGAVKRQPLNYFPHGNPDVYATDYDTFTCDTATGLETPAKFGDTIYSRDAAGLRVNLLISSQVSVPGFGLTLRQVSGLPDVPATALAVVAGAGRMTLRVRIPAWACPPFQVRLNGQPISLTPLPAPSSFIALSRVWRRGDMLDVTFGMRLGVVPAPDMPSVQAVTYGPVVLAGLADGAPGAGGMPVLDVSSVRRVAARPMAFEAVADGRPVQLLPVFRISHAPYTVYWQTA